jgi:hypothetical protein
MRLIQLSLNPYWFKGIFVSILEKEQEEISEDYWILNEIEDTDPGFGFWYWAEKDKQREPLVRTFTTNKGDIVTTVLTDDEAHSICCRIKSSFAQSLTEKPLNFTSSEQKKWMHILAIQELQKCVVERKR